MTAMYRKDALAAESRGDYRDAYHCWMAAVNHIPVGTRDSVERMLMRARFTSNAAECLAKARHCCL